LESLSGLVETPAVSSLLAAEVPDLLRARNAAVEVLQQRQSDRAGLVYDGDLQDLTDSLQGRYGSPYIWSPSQLETYQRCPFYFFVGRVLGLEPREEPAEGLDNRQLGNIYHRLFEKTYSDPRVADPMDLEQLLAVLPEVAAAVLDEAPAREGFRVTAWWTMTRVEIVNNMRRSLEALSELDRGYSRVDQELYFGRSQPLVLAREGETIRLRGFIDRVDHRPGGGVRIIDYKTAGKGGYSLQAIEDGKKLQLLIYALAARDVLGLGEPHEAFYWHVHAAEPSSFKLSKYPEGPSAALDHGADVAWKVVLRVRDGDFGPLPPGDGCPDYCPAAPFCWKYRSGFGGG
jgi:RecB family exonuclease